MDEDRRNGPGGAAGETEDRQPKHRCVRKTPNTLQMILDFNVNKLQSFVSTPGLMFMPLLPQARQVFW